jgi:Prokaryotic homologs of the JAB domain
LGRVYQEESRAYDSSGALTVLTDSIPSRDYRNSSVSLEMGTEIWNRLNDQAAAGKVVVGWYHSHPNLGAFFSGTDRRTQRAFFNHHYSIGWVIDRFRDQQKVFCGGESDEYQHCILTRRASDQARCIVRAEGLRERDAGCPRLVRGYRFVDHAAASAFGKGRCPVGAAERHPARNAGLSRQAAGVLQ